MSNKYRRHYVDPKSIIIESRINGTGLFAAGTTVPVDGTSGYQPGCIFIDEDASAGSQIFINEGTLASCDFNVIAFGAAGLLATAAEINRSDDVSTRLVTLAISTAITEALHEGKTCLLTGTGSALTQTLPAATATGGIYRFVVGAVNTSNHVLVTAGSDILIGNITSNSTGASPDLCSIWIATTSTTCTLNGTTTGGAQIGDWIEVQDILAGKWAIRGCTTSTTAAIPFS